MKKIILLIALSLSFVGLMQSPAWALNKKPLHHSHHGSIPQVEKVNINTATANALTSLKGVGVKRAEAIIAYRNAHGRFATVNDLIKVKGISQKRLQRLVQNNPGRISVK